MDKVHHKAVVEAVPQVAQPPGQQQHAGKVAENSMVFIEEQGRHDRPADQERTGHHQPDHACKKAHSRRVVFHVAELQQPRYHRHRQAPLTVSFYGQRFRPLVRPDQRRGPYEHGPQPHPLFFLHDCPFLPRDGLRRAGARQRAGALWNPALRFFGQGGCVWGAVPLPVFYGFLILLLSSFLLYLFFSACACGTPGGPALRRRQTGCC